ncbi:TerD family protein [Acinetobacter sichuanensis]|uniref:TerD family protein n=2 Tax=Acinetobacter TaxID=469 RepID=A0A371YP29_9GAMM|nr:MULTISPECIES: TerD family protein [Acinetobacter]MDM1247255.1 TerD family protein [Acinetobacter sp. R933-2]MDM1757071.1 TerD family protein [Acinetobacter sp. 256-1]MDM1760146.1 TerD family protein [Acinetobacter sp. 251-1]QOW46254.1 TerD family protein [Acinetobacter piscicola]RFC83216.1 TerD family protein [Acinetobacter sichuanensis]
MGISLVKGQKISLEKPDGSSLTKIYLGAGWDVAKGGGFLGGLFGGGGGSIDLDASAILFDANKQVLDNVWFAQLRSRDGSIQHSGDNLTGEGDGDDEKIFVDLTRVPDQVQQIVFTISSFRGQTFEKVENAFCRLVDETTNTEVAKYNLSAQGNYTALIIAKVYRHNGAWKMSALGESCQGKTIHDIVPSVLPLL